MAPLPTPSSLSTGIVVESVQRDSPQYVRFVSELTISAPTYLDVAHPSRVHIGAKGDRDVSEGITTPPR